MTHKPDKHVTKTSMGDKGEAALSFSNANGT